MGARVCWVSNHPPLDIQLEVMKRFSGDYELVNITQEYKGDVDIVLAVQNSGCHILVISVVDNDKPDVSVKIPTFFAVFNEIHHHYTESNKCSIFRPESDLVVNGVHMRFMTFKQKIVPWRSSSKTT